MTHALVVAAYRGVSPISRLIRWQTWSPYSHVALGRMPAGGGVRLWAASGEMIEAWHKGGVTARCGISEGHTPGTRVDVFQVAESARFAEVAWQLASMAVGEKYDFLGVARFLPRGDRYLKDNDRWFCSELVFDSLANAGCHLLRRIQAQQVSPGALVTSPRLSYMASFYTQARLQSPDTPQGFRDAALLAGSCAVCPDLPLVPRVALAAGLREDDLPW